ncbi:uncharacterized protein PRCAT00005498001 [Priceomyces carsonii]|uniref:uncharacterized protein n=1 Tax=Priceomyces carsonii TaxID=28549 RepID=UPI002ED8D5CF|nr:unnamed protein product [Priceomyces carsonii]
MSSSELLDSLTSEVESFTNTGYNSVSGLLKESNNFLSYLKEVESSLSEDLKTEEQKTKDPQSLSKFETEASQWYKESISQLKSYNTSTNKFLKNILNNSKFNIDLDEAYTYPLNLNNYPERVGKGSSAYNGSDISLKAIKAEGHEELLKAIILHLLKIGQCDLVKEMVKELDHDVVIEEELLSKFKVLNEIVDDIIMKHDITRALNWFKDRYNNSMTLSNSLKNIPSQHNSSSDQIEFKFHMLQFALLLNNGSSFNLDNALQAYLYSKEHFSRFFVDYLHEISPMLTLLLFKTSRDDDDDDYARKHMVNLLSEFTNKMKLCFRMDQDNNRTVNGSSMFVGELLANFEHLHSNPSIFVNLANEFISEYCKDLKLSNDSSLFQSILAGFINLPSFYKYNKIQMKLSKIKNDPEVEGSKIDRPTILEADYSYDLPFQLPDSSRFLFKYHPIFICPISKEQLIPVTNNLHYDSDDKHKKKKKRSTLDPSSNTALNLVVVLNFCQHLALRESVWQISKKGTEIFNCHYCYKKHKFSDVSEAYFIDL